jgi:hypothetical protein
MTMILENTPCRVCMTWYISVCLYADTEMQRLREQGVERPVAARLADGTIIRDALAGLSMEQWIEAYRNRRFDVAGWDLPVDDILLEKLGMAASIRAINPRNEDPQ